MKRDKLLTMLLLCCFVWIAASIQKEDEIGVANGVVYFKIELRRFAGSCKILETAVADINQDSVSVTRAKNALVQCRLDYKKVSFFLSYFFPSETNFYNAAPKTEVEEPELELVEPMGLQYLEALLFEENVCQNKAKLIEQVHILTSSVNDLPALLYDFIATDAQILESVRIELIRSSTLSISGFDAPLLKSSMAELEVSHMAMKEVLKPYIKLKPKNGKAIDDLLNGSILYLKAHQDFDSFNRMQYLLDYALPLQKKLHLLINELKLSINTTQFLNYEADNIYMANALKPFTPANENLVALGERLFSDPKLSGNLKVSCATCHQKDNYFTDLLPRSGSLLKDSILKRNTPTLLYSGWQHSQFWDGRAASLNEQVRDVLFNKLEMGGSEHLLSQNIIKSKVYAKDFVALFPKVKIKKMGANEISMAISAYISKLGLMNAAFDQQIQSKSKAMTTQQIEGFNLFMGKAQCGTCHFPPFFNGLIPPFYERSEVEILGTTKDGDFQKPQLDTDFGRFDLYQINYYKSAFKTPTVRNSAKTFPYMHNGGFKDLTQVVEFYNLGGGKGLGLDVPDQTLSAMPLKLTKAEVASIVAFMESLTDVQILNHNNLNYQKNEKN